MAKWRTHSICCGCKKEMLKIELTDGICAICKGESKTVKMSRKNSKVVTKRKSSNCFHCFKKINVGEKAVNYEYEHFFKKQYGTLHLECVTFTD